MRVDTKPRPAFSPTGDHDRFAHYINSNLGDVTGRLVTALCGKTWRPIMENPPYPMCPTCEEVRWGLR